MRNRGLSVLKDPAGQKPTTPTPTKSPAFGQTGTSKQGAKGRHSLHQGFGLEQGITPKRSPRQRELTGYGGCPSKYFDFAGWPIKTGT